MSEQSVIKKEINIRLMEVIDPRNGRDILNSGVVQNINGREASDGLHITLTLELPGGASDSNNKLMDQAKQAVASIPEIDKVTIIATEHNPAKATSNPGSLASGHANPLGVQGKKQPAPSGKIDTSSIKNIILVASGKGGVGKSTIAANLAIALSQQGMKTGLMDADIYGPSLPTILGIKDRAPFKDGKIQAIDVHSIKAMSIGLLLEEDKALAWRGPMVMGAVQQLLVDVEWGALDVLIVDTPPGTGDAHLTLLQKVDVTGAIIVSTPQEMALADVRRGAALFQKMDTPIIGLVENMSWLELPNGQKQKLFGDGGAVQAAKKLGVAVLGQVPLYPALAEASDSGTPLAVQNPDAPENQIIKNISKTIIDHLNL